MPLLRITLIMWKEMYYWWHASIQCMKWFTHHLSMLCIVCIVNIIVILRIQRCLRKMGTFWCGDLSGPRWRPLLKHLLQSEASPAHMLLIKSIMLVAPIHMRMCSTWTCRRTFQLSTGGDVLAVAIQHWIICLIQCKTSYCFSCATEVTLYGVSP